jgi:hypothetical protein
VTGRRIAVAGSGVAGLTAAYLLSRGGDEMTLFEAGDRLGGHADTHTVTGPGGRDLAIDTGFIVPNQRTYPLLTRLFGELGVSTQPAEMSMSVRCRGCGLAYSGQPRPRRAGRRDPARACPVPADAPRPWLVCRLGPGEGRFRGPKPASGRDARQWLAADGPALPRLEGVLPPGLRSSAGVFGGWR